MRARALAVALLAALAVLVVLPAQALAHATLERTVPSASATTSSPPKEVSLTFSEGIEPRFAIVSVTDAGGHQVTAGAPAHPPGDGTTLVVPLKDVKQGWYLVYWRVISADGHPVRGAFTFAVGPSPGPAPQFPIPSLSETAATPTLVIERWTMLLSLMIGVGLLMFRLIIARPVAARVENASAAAGRHRRRRGARHLPGGDAGVPDPGDGASSRCARRRTSARSYPWSDARRSAGPSSTSRSSSPCSPCAPGWRSGSTGRGGRPARSSSSSRCSR